MIPKSGNRFSEKIMLRSKADQKNGRNKLKGGKATWRWGRWLLPDGSRRALTFFASAAGGFSVLSCAGFATPETKRMCSAAICSAGEPGGGAERAARAAGAVGGSAGGAARSAEAAVGMAKYCTAAAGTEVFTSGFSKC